MKISALIHTQLLEDPSKQPFPVELPLSAKFRGALLAVGQPKLLVGANLAYPIVIMSFSYDPDRAAERGTRWFQLVTGPVELPDSSVTTFLAALWEGRPPPQGPAPVLLYEVNPP